MKAYTTEIKFYKTSDGREFANVRLTGKRTGIVAEYDTATFPYVYYYPHLRLYSKVNYIPRYEEMADGCPCMDCGNLIANNCAMLERGRCSQLEQWQKANDRRRNPKQLTLF